MAANRSSSRNLTRRIIANTTDTYRSAWANSQYDPVKLFGEGASTHMDILCRWVLNQKPNDKVDRDMLMSLKSMVRAYADWTPDLLRFSDRRHAKFQGVPDANGNNIQQNLSQDELGGLSLYGSETLSKMFRYYADDWLRMLHYKELCPCWYDQHRQPVSVEIRATELEETLVAKAKDLASLEKEKYNLNKEIDKRYEIEDITLHWTNELRRSCVEGIRAMAAADMWAYERHMDRLKAVYDAYTTVPRISRVMVMCLSAHADFEHRLRFLHVEDESIRKRIFICAWDTKKKLIESGQHAFLSHLESKHWPKADDAARYIGAELSNLFDYRLIRDWGFGRPWAGLELYIDAGFHKLNDIITRIRNITSGSSKDLLAVKPVDMYDIIRMQDRSCDICTTDFKDLEVVMRLRCGHPFHPECIFPYWDTYRSQGWPCPICRHNQFFPVTKHVNFHCENDDFVIPDMKELEDLQRSETRRPFNPRGLMGTKIRQQCDADLENMRDRFYHAGESPL